MKKCAIFALFIALISSCGVKKPECTPVIVTNDHVDMVSMNEANSILSYRINEGPLKGSLVIINRHGEAEKTTHITLTNLETNIQCLGSYPETWVWEENRNETGDTLTLKGTAKLSCGEKNYCLEFSYSGPTMKTPGAPPAPGKQ